MTVSKIREINLRTLFSRSPVSWIRLQYTVEIAGAVRGELRASHLISPKFESKYIFIQLIFTRFNLHSAADFIVSSSNRIFQKYVSPFLWIRDSKPVVRVPQGPVGVRKIKIGSKNSAHHFVPVDPDHYVFRCPLTAEFHLKEPSDEHRKRWFKNLRYNGQAQSKLIQAFKISNGICDRLTQG
ncbi:hypothetical protein AVEN_54246-1 [Araneus ventricosus]|uniref:Uncharacterized protein n=1 Tax=Araneus ventricosus TaxID=182803 RepID=A0A4Y2WD08_ARAVE|nr:hypothetical protein AVEN_54246-1 [Araneus ventricosus]